VDLEVVGSSFGSGESLPDVALEDSVRRGRWHRSRADMRWNHGVAVFAGRGQRQGYEKETC
jgi:hypothetical protein